MELIQAQIDGWMDWRYPASFLRYYTFKPNEDRVYAYTFNLRTKSYETDSNSQFPFYYDMEPLQKTSSY
jgi:hypothetical protein